MTRGIGDLDVNSIQHSIESAVQQYSSEYSDYPPIHIENAYIRGSYAAGEATESSDLDVLIEVGVSSKDHFTVGVLGEHIIGAHNHIRTAIEKYSPTECDLKVIPADPEIREAVGAPDTERYLNRSKEIKGSEATYDIYEESYKEV